MSEVATTAPADPTAPVKKRRGPGMSKIVVPNPKKSLSKEELKQAFGEYEEIQEKLRALEEQKTELKEQSSAIVELIVQDQGNQRFTVGGKLYKPGKHGEHYFFIAPDTTAVDLDD